MVLTADPAVGPPTGRSSRSAGRSRTGPAPGCTRARTPWTPPSVGRDAMLSTSPDGTAAGIVRLAAPVAARARAIVSSSGEARRSCRSAASSSTSRPPRGISRRRQTVVRVAALASGGPGARLELHGALSDGGAAGPRAGCAGAGRGLRRSRAVADEASLADRARRGRRDRCAGPCTVPRETPCSPRPRSSTTLVAAAGSSGTVTSSGDPAPSGRITDPGARRGDGPPRDAAGHDDPSAAADAARMAAAPRWRPALERAARIVVLEADLAYAMSTYRDLAARAMAMATDEPLTPAAYRDATGTSRKYVMAILEDLDRRTILRRTPEGHVLGPKAPRPAGRGRYRPVDAGATSGRSCSPGALVAGSAATSWRSRSTAVPLLDHAIAAVRSITERVVVVAAPDADPPVPEGVTLVHDARPLRGPPRRARRGPDASPVERVIVVGGDMPGLVPAVLLGSWSRPRRGRHGCDPRGRRPSRDPPAGAHAPARRSVAGRTCSRPGSGGWEPCWRSETSAFAPPRSGDLTTPTA